MPSATEIAAYIVIALFLISVLCCCCSSISASFTPITPMSTSDDYHKTLIRNCNQAVTPVIVPMSYSQ